jgi:hypothetical protein
LVAENADYFWSRFGENMRATARDEHAPIQEFIPPKRVEIAETSATNKNGQTRIETG